MEGNGDPVVQNPHTSVEMGSVSQRTPSFSRLRLACEGGLEGFQEEMRNYPDPLGVRVEPHHRTPLHLAALSGQVDIVKDILDRLSQNPSTVDVIANAQKVVNAKDSFGDTPLHLAVRAQHEGVVRVLIESPSWVLPDRFIRDCEGYTPLHVAAERDSIQIVKLLLQQSVCRGEFNGFEPVNIRATTWNGHSALDLARFRCSGTRDKAKLKGHEKMVETLECSDLSYLQSERDKHANFLNAVLVGAVFIAAAASSAGLQLVPADLSPNLTPNNSSEFLWITSSFVLALQALVIGTLAMMPFAQAPLLSEVKHLRRAVWTAGISLMSALCYFVFAFTEHCFSVLGGVTRWLLVGLLLISQAFWFVYFVNDLKKKGLIHS